MPRAMRSKERYKINWQLKRGLTRPIILRYQLAVYKKRFILECVTATIRDKHYDYNLNWQLKRGLHSTNYLWHQFGGAVWAVTEHQDGMGGAALRERVRAYACTSDARAWLGVSQTSRMCVCACV